MNKILRIRAKNLLVRTLKTADVTAEYASGLNDPEVSRYLVEACLTTHTAVSLKKFVTANLRSPDAVLLGIFTGAGTRLIGTIRISKISRFHHLCSLGICIFDKDSWGKGYAIQALKAVKKIVFDDMKIHYIEAGVYAENVPSVKLFRRAGFKIEAVFKDKYRHGASFKKVFLFGSVNPRFPKSILK